MVKRNEQEERLRKKRLALVNTTKKHFGIKNLKNPDDKKKVYDKAAEAANFAAIETDRVEVIERFYSLGPEEKKLVQKLKKQDEQNRQDAKMLARQFVEDLYKLDKLDQKKGRGRKKKSFLERLEELKNDKTLSPEAKRVRIARLKKAMMEETPFIQQPDYLIKKYLEEEGIRKKSQTQKEKERKQKKKEEKYQKWLQTPEGKAYLKQKQKEEREIEKMEREIEREKKRMEKRLQKLEKEEEMKRKEKKK